MSEERVVKRNIKRPSRKKVCNFCVDKVTEIDYKDTNKLKKYKIDIIGKQFLKNF